jgi:mannan endo-1,6-alpha-mannosidase
MSFYVPSPSGVFEQAQTPWHESGMIWGMYMDYAKYTGDTQFLDIVTGALVNTSYGPEQYVFSSPYFVFTPSLDL